MAKLLVKVFELFKYLKNSVMMNEKENIQDENLEQNENNQEQETQEEVAELSQEEILTNQLAETNDRFARLFAEFDNYKKRTSKERVELISTAGEKVISKLLTVLDDFDRALNAMSTAQDVESVKQGVELVNSKFRKILENEGLKEMNVVGETFDADFQEAITAIPSPSEDMKNKVIDVVEKGYTLNDKVIRFAKVVIGQ
ncbi:MAG TPA: nucleotide exchange factor GrpE [Sphingobacterium bovisgrunnientis]|jgi:molecular chaperone GrpE|uniref:nucleotide exchange factor GrpE n=1 Tax=Sphingobacterium TaxID=28453 RepID=UPI001CB840FD|nr:MULTISPECIES: nucleotide exchange factor GrpE [Sphingobacterium]HLS36698.1 nucleotide exchange factor GrpE [Sphingobacterium bovisgrunnientis]